MRLSDTATRAHVSRPRTHAADRSPETRSRTVERSTDPGRSRAAAPTVALRLSPRVLHELPSIGSTVAGPVRGDRGPGLRLDVPTGAVTSVPARSENASIPEIGTGHGTPWVPIRSCAIPSPCDAPSPVFRLPSRIPDTWDLRPKTRHPGPETGGHRHTGGSGGSAAPFPVPIPVPFGSQSARKYCIIHRRAQDRGGHTWGFL